jgi:hypothetical protein
MHHAATYWRLRRKGLAQCASGVTTLEFAFLVPVFLLLIMGIIEFSMIMFTMSVMESATANTSRLGKTGYVSEGMTRQEQIIANIRDKTAGILNPGRIQITTTVYSSMSRVNEPEPFIDQNGNGAYNSGEPFTDINGNGTWDEDMGVAGLGGANDVVVYTVSYPWHVTTPIISRITGDPFVITVRSVVKNEPF